MGWKSIKRNNSLIYNSYNHVTAQLQKNILFSFARRAFAVLKKYLPLVTDLFP